MRADSEYSAPTIKFRRIFFLLLAVCLIVSALLFLPERSAHQATMPESAILAGGTRQSYEPFEPYVEDGEEKQLVSEGRE